jgi:hypothetical protein
MKVGSRFDSRQVASCDLPELSSDGVRDFLEVLRMVTVLGRRESSVRRAGFIKRKVQKDDAEKNIVREMGMASSRPPYSDCGFRQREN